ncbi:hypothetical protein CRBSH125_29560 [Afipia carboxidovorans]|nr:hypothetical protein CRBSH125_29560 [Afipia carboxidovorans]
MEKAGSACAERRPNVAIPIDRPQHDEGQFRKEKAMLVDEVAANNPRPHDAHAIGDAGAALHMHFANVPRREFIVVAWM